MEWLRKLDYGWSRVESALTVFVLIAMVLVAGFQASIRNLSYYDLAWASDLLTNMAWADSFLRKGTLWLAFLGASLATYYEKHIGIDVLLRIAPPRAKWVMRALVSLLTAVVTVALMYAFWDAVKLNLMERPIEYEVLGPEGAMHVCDAPDELMQEFDFERPGAFCAMRAAYNAVGVPAETPGAAFQIIVPLMFFIMAVRFLGKGVAAIRILSSGEQALLAAEEQKERYGHVDSGAAVSGLTAPASEEDEDRAKHHPGSGGSSNDRDSS